MAFMALKVFIFWKEIEPAFIWVLFQWYILSSLLDMFVGKVGDFFSCHPVYSFESRFWLTLYVQQQVMKIAWNSLSNSRRGFPPSFFSTGLCWRVVRYVFISPGNTTLFGRYYNRRHRKWELYMVLYTSYLLNRGRALGSIFSSSILALFFNFTFLSRMKA